MRRTGQDYNRLLVRYALERLLYRLSLSDHPNRFVLKGAMLLAVWSDQQYRTTQDLDLLGFGDGRPESLIGIFKNVAGVTVGVNDGMVYLPDSITAETIREDQRYGGIRIRIESTLGKARIPLLVDVGFGDAITPPPQPIIFPTLLDYPAPAIQAYPKETVVAEKFEAMVSLELLNTRMKDFADIWYMSRHFGFDGAVLSEAISETFARRGTPIDLSPVAFTDAYTDSARQAQWIAFLRRTSAKDIPGGLAEVVTAAAVFLLPVAKALAAGAAFTGAWSPAEGWKPAAQE